MTCIETMRAILESTASEYHAKNGKVDDDFFHYAAKAMALICHPEFFDIDGFNMGSNEIGELETQLTDRAAEPWARNGPASVAAAEAMRRAAKVMAAMRLHVFHGLEPDLPPANTKNT